MSGVDVFVSFDVEHDDDLHERLVEQSNAPGAAFEVSGESERYTATEAWSTRVRRRIRAAEHVIVLCGEHTETSIGVFSEIRIAQEEGKLYLLLWGRREVACTKPAGAKKTEGMYSWTEPILQDQLTQMARRLHQERLADRMKRVGKPQSGLHAAAGASAGSETGG